MPAGSRYIVNIDLHSYPPFSGKEIVGPKLLPQQGYSNENYIFYAEEKPYLLRKFKLEDRNRELEYRVQLLAYEKGIAAQPLILDLSKNLMVCEFLEGEHKTLLKKEDLARLATVLKKVHCLQTDAEVMQLEMMFGSISDGLKEAFRVIETFPEEPVLCHNDPNPKNLIFSASGLKLIDWEFAGINDRYFDLAAVSVEFNLDLLDEAYFLASYFRMEGWEKEKLEAYKTVYKALCEQWFQSNT